MNARNMIRRVAATLPWVLTAAACLAAYHLLRLILWAGYALGFTM